MSYEEARKHRAKNRKQNDIGMILGLLSGMGQSIYQVQKQKQSEELQAQANALAERRMQLGERQFTQEGELAGERNKTQLEVARINAEGRGQSDKVSEWQAQGEGLIDSLPEAEGDPQKAIKILEKRRADLMRQSVLSDPKPIDDQLKLLYGLSGSRKMRGQQQRLQPQRTADLDPNAGMPEQSGMLPDPNVGNPIMQGGPMMKGWMGATQTAPQSVHAGIAWERATNAYRRLMSNGPRDIAALEELNQLFGGTLPVPRSAAVAPPLPMQRTATGMGTTTVPR